MQDEAWNRVERLRTWLDENAVEASDSDVRLLRVLKIGEEFGEVAEALHGAMGANPRKGASHTWDDVNKELCDVIVTGMVALASCTPDARKLLDERLQHLVDRRRVVGPGRTWRERTRPPQVVTERPGSGAIRQLPAVPLVLPPGERGPVGDAQAMRARLFSEPSSRTSAGVRRRRSYAGRRWRGGARRWWRCSRGDCRA